MTLRAAQSVSIQTQFNLTEFLCGCLFGWWDKTIIVSFEHRKRAPTGIQYKSQRQDCVSSRNMNERLVSLSAREGEPEQRRAQGAVIGLSLHTPVSSRMFFGHHRCLDETRGHKSRWPRFSWVCEWCLSKPRQTTCRPGPQPQSPARLTQYFKHKRITPLVFYFFSLKRHKYLFYKLDVMNAALPDMSIIPPVLSASNKPAGRNFSEHPSEVPSIMSRLNFSLMSAKKLSFCSNCSKFYKLNYLSLFSRTLSTSDFLKISVLLDLSALTRQANQERFTQLSWSPLQL